MGVVLLLGQFGLGLALGYLLVTVAESFLHEHLHHAGPRFRRLQARFPRALGAFREAYRSHAIVHHGLTYPDHVTQFRDAAHRAQVDAALRDPAGQRIAAEGYGTTLGLRSAVQFVLPVLPAVAAAVALLPWVAGLGFCLPVMIYPLMSMVIHPYLHEPYAAALARAPAGVRWALGTRYVRAVWRHHWLHHRYPRSNFNLLLGGDWVRGRHRRPTAPDLRAMRALGLPVA